MKPAELQKFNAMKLVNRMKNTGTHGHPGGTVKPVDRREQRRLDQAAGLVPFAVKINGELIKQINTLAAERKTGVNQLVAELLQKALKK
ncbi:MAG: hypothetical protein K2Y31_07070 [Burkholderiales bacterium]|nr:hypothetical protein [Burkholderiales bacterium]